MKNYMKFKFQFINKILLEHSMFIHLHIVYDYFPATAAELRG